VDSQQSAVHHAWESRSRRAPQCASLSVIVLSLGDRTDLERALGSIASRCRKMEAEIIVIRGGQDAGEQETLSAAYPSVRFLLSAAGASTADMRALGMACACGDIISLKTDAAVGDGNWLEAFDATVGQVEEGAPFESEVPVVHAVDGLEAPSVDWRRGRSQVRSPGRSASHRDWRADSSRRISAALPLDFDPDSSAAISNGP
jgi:hypothetical protein